MVWIAPLIIPMMKQCTENIITEKFINPPITVLILVILFNQTEQQVQLTKKEIGLPLLFCIQPIRTPFSLEKQMFIALPTEEIHGTRLAPLPADQE
jgi:hypothetical protein